MAEIQIEAAMNSPDGTEGYFFLADHYVIYDWASDRCKDGVHPTADFGLPAAMSPVGSGPGLDAALTGRAPHADKVYFFLGGQYARVNWNPRAVETPVPAALALWVLAGAF